MQDFMHDLLKVIPEGPGKCVWWHVIQQQVLHHRFPTLIEFWTSTLDQALLGISTPNPPKLNLVLGRVIPLAAHTGSYTGMLGEGHEVQKWCVDKALVNVQ